MDAWQYSLGMPWIDPTEVFAKRPRLDDLTTDFEDWSGEIENGPDGGLIEGYVIAGVTLDAVVSDGLAIVESELSGVDFVTDHRKALDIRGSTLRDCDLSGARIRSLRSVTVLGSRVSGANLSAASLRDVVFEDCIFQYANLGSSQLSRVAFIRCKLEETDFTGAKLTDVTFEGSELRLVDLSNTFFERVDLREAASLSFSSGRSLSGCLISDAQVQELAYGLALTAGASIERSGN